ncbi:MAG: hypothetical protein ACI4MT_02785 [Christensenellales bacterium]
MKVSKMNKEQFAKTVRKMRIAWAVCLVLAPVFLGLGIYSLVTKYPLLPLQAAIPFTIVGSLCALGFFYLTFFSFIVPAMIKMSPTMTKQALEANRDNIKLFLSIREGKDPFPQPDETEQNMFCKHCGKQIPCDSTYCKHCGEKQ